MTAAAVGGAVALVAAVEAEPPDVVVADVRMPPTHTDEGLGRLTERERAVLDQMAQGQTNATIAGQLHVSQSAVEKHVNAIFDKLGLSQTTGYSRRVLAVLRYLGS